MRLVVDIFVLCFLDVVYVIFLKFKIAYCCDHFSFWLSKWFCCKHMSLLFYQRIKNSSLFKVKGIEIDQNRYINYT